MKKLLLALIITNILNTSAQSNLAFDVDGIIGKLPTKIYLLVHQMNHAPSTILKNFALLYGPPGNGKTTLARKIAQLTESEFIRLDGPSIVNPYVGQGARNIQEIYKQAENETLLGKKVIVFFDEIDAIASNVKSDYRSEHRGALQQLWLKLDEFKHNPNIFTIFATNHMDKLDVTFLDRFGANTIEIKNPDAQLRRLVLEHYISKTAIHIDANLLTQLVKATDGLSIRSLEDLVNELFICTIIEKNDPNVDKEMAWKILKQIKSKFTNSLSAEERDKRLQRIALYLGIGSAVLVGAVHIGQISSLILNYYWSAQKREALKKFYLNNVINKKAMDIYATDPQTSHNLKF